MSSRFWLPASMAFLALAWSCSPSTPPREEQIPTDPPYIEGTVTRVTATAVLVETSPSQPSGSPKVQLRITDDTAIFWRSGDPARALDLQLGTRVRAWVTGPVMESYPEQASARAIVIVSVDLPVQHPA